MQQLNNILRHANANRLTLHANNVFSQGWKSVKHTRNKGVQLEVYPDDDPLGSWRGSYTVETATYEDVLSYLKDKLGADQFELLYDDDAAMVFREYFSFSQFAKKGTFVHAVAGDHRGEAAERMSDVRRPSVTQKGRPSALRQKSNLKPMLEEEIVVDDGPEEDEDEDDDQEEGKSNRKLRASATKGGKEGGSEVAPEASSRKQSLAEEDEMPDPVLALTDASANANLSWRQRLFGDRSKSQRFSKGACYVFQNFAT